MAPPSGISMDMSATVMMILGIGVGLSLLGAFFLWRLAGQYGGWWTVLAAVLPALCLAVIAAVEQVDELAVGMLWGMVAVHCLNLGLLSLFGQARGTRAAGCMAVVWLAFGGVACLLMREHGLGVFSGLALCGVGLVAMWQWLHRTPWEAATAQPKHRWAWGWLVMILIALVGGGVLIVGQYAQFCGMVGIPQTAGAALIVTPLLAAVPWVALWRRRVTAEQLWHGWTGGNALLGTLGLGLVVLVAGGVNLTQSLVTVVLPWVAGMAVLSVVALFLPQKTARWWGGLLVVLGIVYVISWLG